MSEVQRQGISRRELLKKGAALGGAVVWVTPVVQTIGMGRAFATEGSPVTGLSYIALNVACGDTYYTLKWEADVGDWVEPGAVPGCPGFTPSGTKALGDDLGFGISSIGGDCFALSIPANCRFIEGVAKGGVSTCTAITNPSNICL